MAEVQGRSQSQKQKIRAIRRGEIYLCAFDPAVGHEITKIRPALVLQNDIGNSVVLEYFMEPKRNIAEAW